jgi:hypothetical protein
MTSLSSLSSLIAAPVLGRGGGRAAMLAAAPADDRALKTLTEAKGHADRIAQSMKETRDAARSSIKAKAAETLERLKDEYKLIKRIWAGNPKAMAQQLARIAKELKAAVKDYAKANEDFPPTREMTASAAPVEAKKAEAKAVETEAAAADDKAAQASDGAATMAAQAAGEPGQSRAEQRSELVARYASAARAGEAAGETQASKAARLSEAKTDLEFTRGVRGFLKELREAFDLIKIKAALLAKDEDRDEAFKEVAKTFKELDRDVGDLEKGAREVESALSGAASGVSTGATASATA